MTTPAGQVQNTFGVTQGETNGQRVVQLNGIGDVTNVTAVTHIWQKTGVIVNLACTVANGVDSYGTPCAYATVSLGTWINTATGVWRMRQALVFPGGFPLSWPEFGWDELVVSIDGS